MTQPINPLTTLTTSLQVDKLEQTKNMADMLEQGIIGQEQELDNARKEKRVNQNEELDKGQLDKDENGSGSGHNSEEKEDKENGPSYAKKGDVFDVKI
ncbi:MAG: hypothetical protein ABR596_00025 [Halarsenatibacteraceae bacterium]